MSRFDRDRMTELAGEQLPLAAQFGLGHELNQLADALLQDEQPVRLATASMDGRFGVLALTTNRLLWIPAGRSTSVLTWPRGAADLTQAGETCSISVMAGDRTSELEGILPSGAAKDLSERLSRHADLVV